MKDTGDQSVPRVVIINDASVARGGATGLSLFLVKLLREQGIEVTYVCGDAGDAPELKALGVQIIALGGQQLVAQSRLGAFRSGLYNGAARDMLAGVIEKQDSPDTVYHVHGWSKILSPAIFDALRPVASRTLIHAHDFFLACPNGGFMDYQAETPCRRVPLSAACLTTHCDKRSYPQKIWRVARSVQLRRSFDRSAPWGGIAMIHPAMADAFVRSGFPASLLWTVRNPVDPFSTRRVRVEDNQHAFFVGRVEAEKGIEDLIAACHKAAMPLTVLGDGPLRETLSEKHPDVTFSGWCDRAEITRQIQTARVLAMPSRYPEPFGLVAVEASRSGIPVVLSQTALLADEIDQTGLGWACDTTDIDAFAARLQQIKALPRDEISRISKSGFAGGAHLAETPASWRDGLIGHYSRLVLKTSQNTDETV